MSRTIHRQVIAQVIALGFLAALSVQARSDDAGRETIIQGVRDDIRRRIQEDNQQPAATSEQAASAARQPQTTPAPPPADPKQEPAK
jgi:hypothetical protein